MRRNTELISQLSTNVATLTQSVSQVQRQVSIATDEIGKLKTSPMRKGSFESDEPTAARPTTVAK